MALFSVGDLSPNIMSVLTLGKFLVFKIGLHTIFWVPHSDDLTHLWDYKIFTWHVSKMGVSTLSKRPSLNTSTQL